MKAKRYNYFRRTIVILCLTTISLSVGCCGTHFNSTGKSGKVAMIGAVPTVVEKSTACKDAKISADANAACPHAGDPATYTEKNTIGYDDCDFVVDNANKTVEATVVGTYKCCKP